jgi:glycosyltransferase involved in cell wall biosynthesis
MKHQSQHVRWFAFCFSLILGTCPLFGLHRDVEFYIVIPSYNNNKADAAGKNWIEDNLESVFRQTYKKWTIEYVNDCSKDGTGQVAEQFALRRGMRQKCHITNNPVNRGALANLYTAISRCDPRKVVVLIDGDDKLSSPKALERVAKEYRTKKAWITYGSFKSIPFLRRGLGAAFPAKIIKQRAFRKYGWVSSHLRTFYAKLFQSIKRDDLMFKGKFFGGGWDLIIMFPMLEMASQGHIRYIPDILYYWRTHALNDCNIHSDEQRFANEWVRAQHPYRAKKWLFPIKKKKAVIAPS